MPIDVKVRCVGGLRSILEHVHPPGVFIACGHVVRHDVEDQAHTTIAQLSLQGEKVRFGAKFRIEARGVNDVVAMRASATTAQYWGSVQVSNAQRGKIIQQPWWV